MNPSSLGTQAVSEPEQSRNPGSLGTRAVSEPWQSQNPGGLGTRAVSEPGQSRNPGSLRTWAVSYNVYLYKGSHILVYRTQAPCFHIRLFVYRYLYKTNTGLLDNVNNNHHACHTLATGDYHSSLAACSWCKVSPPHCKPLPPPNFHCMQFT